MSEEVELTTSQLNNRRKRRRLKAMKAELNTRTVFLEDTLRQVWTWLSSEYENPDLLREILLRADADYQLRVELAKLEHSVFAEQDSK